MLQLKCRIVNWFQHKYLFKQFTSQLSSFKCQLRGYKRACCSHKPRLFPYMCTFLRSAMTNSIKCISKLKFHRIICYVISLLPHCCQTNNFRVTIYWQATKLKTQVSLQITMLRRQFINFRLMQFRVTFYTTTMSKFQVCSKTTNFMVLATMQIDKRKNSQVQQVLYLYSHPVVIYYYFVKKKSDQEK